MRFEAKFGSSWIEIPVAWVGLARAKVMSGDTAGAREADWN